MFDNLDDILRKVIPYLLALNICALLILAVLFRN